MGSEALALREHALAQNAKLQLRYVNSTIYQCTKSALLGCIGVPSSGVREHPV